LNSLLHSFLYSISMLFWILSPELDQRIILTRTFILIENFISELISSTCVFELVKKRA